MDTPRADAKRQRQHDSGEYKKRYEAYNRLQAAAVAFGEQLPIPEIVAVGGQSDGKSSLLEALLGFRFNVREVEMGTRRPLILQMLHDPTALQPVCRFQEEEDDQYGPPLVSPSAIADTIKSRTEAILSTTGAAVSSKPIVMRAEYAHCPNLTIIDTPGFLLKAKKGEPENTPDEILSMVKSLATPPHRILLFLQQSSVEWCSSLWLDSIRQIDPTFKRTFIVVSKFDNRLKEFNDRHEVDRYLSASGYIGDNTQPFFVALPKDRTLVSNDEFRNQIAQVDAQVIRCLQDNVKGGFDEEKYMPFIGFSRLKDCLESELQKRYKEAAPATLALLEQRCSEVSAELAKMDSRIQATSDVAHLRKSSMIHTACFCNHVGALIDGAADPAPEQWGKTTDEERLESCLGGWPGVAMHIKPPNGTLRLYGGAAFERVIHEFRCAAYSIECPPVSREKVANILLAHAGRGGNRGVTEAAAEIARASARSWLSPLLDNACDRLAFVLGNLFELAVKRSQRQNSDFEPKTGDMDGYIGFHAALRHSYNSFIKHLAKQCKQLIQHHLDSATSPYYQVCYENELPRSLSSGISSIQWNHTSYGSFSLDLSERGSGHCSESPGDQENIPPGNGGQETTPGKIKDGKDVLRECQITIPETPSPDQPCDGKYVVKKETGNCIEIGARKCHPRIVGKSQTLDVRGQKGGHNLFGEGNNASRAGSAYSEICSSAAHHFSRIREVLVEKSVTSALNSGFLTPCRERLVLALGLDLFAINDERFMDMFVAPGAIDELENERQSLQKRQKTLHSCLNEFKTVARKL